MKILECLASLILFGLILQRDSKCLEFTGRLGLEISFLYRFGTSFFCLLFYRNLTENELVSWKQYSREDKNYLVLNLKPVMKKGPLCEKLKFWTGSVPTLVNYHIGKEEL